MGVPENKVLIANQMSVKDNREILNLYQLLRRRKNQIEKG